MHDISKIKIEGYNYKINLNKPNDISIPIDSIKKGPSFYDENPVKINYYKSNDKEWSVKEEAPCNIPIINLNIHCGSTHTECRSHITKEELSVTDCVSNSFTPCYLISIKPSNNIKDDSYHYKIDKNDLMITRDVLYQKLKNINNQFIKSLIIRTLPNSKTQLTKNYNTNNNAFLSNEAICYLKSIGVKNLIVDLPSIDRYDDGGLLGNHKIFWDINKKECNNNTITELAYINDKIKDGEYLLSLNIMNLKLDASPSRPIIYKILK